MFEDGDAGEREELHSDTRLLFAYSTEPWVLVIVLHNDTGKSVSVTWANVQPPRSKGALNVRVRQHIAPNSSLFYPFQLSRSNDQFMPHDFSPVKCVISEVDFEDGTVWQVPPPWLPFG